MVSLLLSSFFLSSLIYHNRTKLVTLKRAHLSQFLYTCIFSWNWYMTTSTSLVEYYLYNYEYTYMYRWVWTVVPVLCRIPTTNTTALCWQRYELLPRTPSLRNPLLTPPRSYQFHLLVFQLRHIHILYTYVYTYLYYFHYHRHTLSTDIIQHSTMHPYRSVTFLSTHPIYMAFDYDPFWCPEGISIRSLHPIVSYGWVYYQVINMKKNILLNFFYIKGKWLVAFQLDFQFVCSLILGKNKFILMV